MERIPDKRSNTMNYKTLYTIQHPERMNILFTTIPDEAETYSRNGYTVYARRVTA